MEHFNNKTVLITGGTGSFGSTLLSKLFSLETTRVKVFSRDEKKQFDLRKQYGGNNTEFIVGDIRDEKCVSTAVKGVDYIFHAAALKQVPSCEFFPMEAVKTNILGTNNLLHCASQQGVSAVVCLSTDKAVYPINAMGVSKAMMEKVAQSYGRSNNPGDTRVCITRYGNVIGSRGSVIPEFIKRAKKGMPLLLTDPNMTRFLMSLDESVDLVLEGLVNGKSGDLFIKKAPACTIEDLGKAINNITGNKAGIEVMGARHGEKLYESLLTKEELVNGVDLGDYYSVPLDTRDQNYEKYFSEGQTASIPAEDYNSHNTYRLDVSDVEKLITTNRETASLLTGEYL